MGRYAYYGMRMHVNACEKEFQHSPAILVIGTLLVVVSVIAVTFACAKLAEARQKLREKTRADAQATPADDNDDDDSKGNDDDEDSDEDSPSVTVSGSMDESCTWDESLFDTKFAGSGTHVLRAYLTSRRPSPWRANVPPLLADVKTKKPPKIRKEILESWVERKEKSEQSHRTDDKRLSFDFDFESVSIDDGDEQPNDPNIT
uniref:Uncharacterized protein n=1 Tax=Trichuris muris TaxID=70415 RepID=A0A5S6QZM2_TRIMR